MEGGYVRACDLGITWQSSQKTTWIKKVEERVNNEITHLTLGRISASFCKTDWDCYAVRKEFFDVIIKFFSQLPQKYMDNKLESLKRRISDVLDSYAPQDNSGVTNTSSNITIFHCDYGRDEGNRLYQSVY